MGRVTSNRCDILRGEEEHPRSEMKTRATERQNIKMTSRNEVDRGQEESQRTAMLQILQYHITRLDNWKRTTSPFVYKNVVHAPITLVKNVLQMTLKNNSDWL